MEEFKNNNDILMLSRKYLGKTSTLQIPDSKFETHFKQGLLGYQKRVKIEPKNAQQKVAEKKGSILFLRSKNMIEKWSKNVLETPQSEMGLKFWSVHLKRVFFL